jgi:hypothetical protein
MSELSKRVNEFFKSATRNEVKQVKDNIYISEHLNTVFEMFYIQKQDIEFIAFKTGYSRGKIEADLRLLRKKLSKLI